MKKISIIFLASSLLLGCGGEKKSEETVSRGNISISADESLQPIIQAELDGFLDGNKYAKITPVFVPEQLAIDMMLQDSTRIAVVTRHLKPTEKKIFEERKIKYRAFHLATDAVAFITHENSRDTLLTSTEVKGILEGKITNWGQIKGGKSNSKITLVFDRANSSNLQFLLDTLGVQDKSKAPIYAMKSNKEVIEYVQSHPGLVGVIGANWISDIDDPMYPKFMSGIRVLSLGKDPSVAKEDYYKPYQYALALKKYPLSRNIYMITKESGRGLGTGFINYTRSDAGQRIVLKAGLLPATQILRVVQFR